MNEQIKELMKQALQEHYGVPITPGARENAIELVSGWGEKFAELVVKECFELLYQRRKPISNDTTYGAGWVDGRMSGIALIKEHFGVTE